MADVKELDLRLRVSADGSVAVAGLGDVREAVDGVGEGARGAGEPILEMGERLLKLGASYVAVERLQAALLSVVRTGDAWRQMAGQIAAANDAIGDANARLADVVRVALDTNRELSATQELYAALERSSAEWAAAQGRTAQVSAENLEITQAIGNALRMAGTEAQAASGGLRQLAQGLESGVLRGDELNSVLEQMPPVAAAIARQMGIARGELRAYAEQGKVTADVVRAAVLGMADEWAAAAAKMPVSLDEALTNLETRWTHYIGQLDVVQDASEALSGFLDGIGQNLERIGEIAGEGALLLVSAALLKGAQAAAGYAKGLYDAAGAQAANAAAAKQTADAERIAARQAQASAAARAEAAAATLQQAEAQAQASAALSGASRAEIQAAQATRQRATAAAQAAQAALAAAETELAAAKQLSLYGEQRAAIERRVTAAKQASAAASQALAAADAEVAAAQRRYLASARTDRIAAMTAAEKAVTAAKREHAAATQALTAANGQYAASANAATAASATAAASGTRFGVMLGQVAGMARGLAGALTAVPYILIVGELLKIADGIAQIIEQYKEMDRIRLEAESTEAAVEARIRSNLRLYADAAQQRIRSEAELGELSRQEADAYLRRLGEAQRYWAAVEVQARRAGDTQRAAFATAEAERFGAALAEQTKAVEALRAGMAGLSPMVVDALARFDALAGKGKGAAAAIQDVVGALRFDTAAETMVNISTVAGLMQALGASNEEAGQKIRATARDVAEGLGPALDKLSAESLRNFAVEWDVAMAAMSGDQAATTAAVLDTVLRSALGRLKIDLEEIRTGTTAVGRDMLATFEAVAVSSQADAKVIAAAWDVVLAKLSSTADIEHARDMLAELGERGWLSMEQLRAATEDLDRAQAKLVATTGAVADAFKRLGVQSSEQLRLIAEEAERDFLLIRESGTATPRDIAAAWEAYAKRAVESGDRVQQQIARQEAAALGLIDRYDALAGVKARSADAGKRSADEAEREAEALERGADAAKAKAEAQETRRVAVDMDRLFARFGLDIGAFLAANQGNRPTDTSAYLAYAQAQQAAGRVGGGGQVRTVRIEIAGGPAANVTGGSDLDRLVDELERRGATSIG